jgi:hypothetical protein
VKKPQDYPQIYIILKNGRTAFSFKVVPLFFEDNNFVNSAIL